MVRVAGWCTHLEHAYLSPLVVAGSVNGSSGHPGIQPALARSDRSRDVKTLSDETGGNGQVASGRLGPGWKRETRSGT